MSEETYDDFPSMSKETEAQIAAFFLGAPLLAGGAELLGMGMSALLVGAIGGAALALVSGKVVAGGTTFGVQIPRANWSALFQVSETAEDAEVAPPVAEEEPLPPTQEQAQKEWMDLGTALRPHADLVLSNRFALLGMPNAGKSNTIAVLAEELGRFGVPLVIFDQKPEYGRMCVKPYFARPVKASASTITPENAWAFGQRIMNERLQVVLDLPSYEDDDVAATVMIEVIKGIWAWENALPNNKRIPCMLIVDEADYWLPQSEQHAHVDRSKKDDKGRSLFVRLQNTFFNVVHRGRSWGLGIIVCSQRPANVDNRAIAVAEWKILLKANMPHDLAVYKSFGVAPEIAMNLARGQAYVLGPGEIKGVFQLRKRRSPDDSQTPGLRNLRRGAVMETAPPDVSDLESTGNDVETPLETATEADAVKVVNEAFPVSLETQGQADTRVETNERDTESLVSADLMEAIRMMKEKSYPDREIASLARLSGRKYKVYQRVLQRLGYREEA